MYLKQRVYYLVKRAVQALQADGVLPPNVSLEPELERPAQAVHGDFSTNLAMKLAKLARKAPREIAAALANKLSNSELCGQVEVAGPGFVNLKLKTECLLAEAEAIRSVGDHYGTSDDGKDRRVLLEFVSANPTGPLNIVSARAAAVGDALANILKSQGVNVFKEYYINDAGRQARLLGHSMLARQKQKHGENYPVPEGGYEKDYVIDIANECIEAQGKTLTMASEAEAVELNRCFGVAKLKARHEKSLADYGVSFDNWYSELTLHQSGKVEEAVADLEKHGCVYEKDNALWFESTKFGDDKDRVLRKADGDWAYLATDIAYHREKYARGYTELLDLWGPDHHGYIARLQAAMQAFGHVPGAFQVHIVQQVNLREGGKLISMSKRGEGSLLEMDDLIREVGKDVARFFFLMRSTDAHLDFDLDLARQHSEDNPVYYVQYAYARICSILKKAEAESLSVPGVEEQVLRNHQPEPEELALIRELSVFPEILATCVRSLEPHGLAFYLRDLATSFHRFYTVCRVVDKEARECSQGRLALIDATRIVLKNGLTLLGISAPESM